MISWSLLCAGSEKLRRFSLHYYICVPSVDTPCVLAICICLYVPEDICYHYLILSSSFCHPNSVIFILFHRLHYVVCVLSFCHLCSVIFIASSSLCHLHFVIFLLSFFSVIFVPSSSIHHLHFVIFINQMVLLCKLEKSS